MFESFRMLTMKWRERVETLRHPKVLFPLLTIALSTFAIVTLVNDAPRSVTTNRLKLPPLSNYYENRKTPWLTDIELRRLGITKPEMPKNNLFNSSKLAVLVERRNMSNAAPLLLHFANVVPPDWRFRFLGSPESIAFIKQSLPIRNLEKLGKLDIFVLPDALETHNVELLSQTLTNPAFYSHVLYPAEHVLLFQTDSILCSKASKTVDDFLQYAYVGAPWRRYTYGGNGGLSLRRVSRMLKILKRYERQVDSDPEDLWLSKRLKWIPGTEIAYKPIEMEFSVESVWYDKPLGYHLGGSGLIMSKTIWGTEERREMIYDYCPEVKMILQMRLPDAYGCPPNDTLETPRQPRGYLSHAQLTPWML